MLSEVSSDQITYRCQRALDRLLQIDWAHRRIYDDATITPSCIALAREFVRRVLLWHPGLLAPSTAHAVDLVAALVPAAPMPASILRHAEQVLPLSPRYGLRLCLNFLKWTAIEHLPTVSDRPLPAPYEPAIRLFERGGELWSEHGFLHVHHSLSFVTGYGAYCATPALLDLTDAGLDRFDQQAAR